MKEGLSNKIKDVVIEVGEIIEGKVSKLQEEQVQVNSSLREILKEKPLDGGDDRKEYKRKRGEYGSESFLQHK